MVLVGDLFGEGFRDFETSGVRVNACQLKGEGLLGIDEIHHRRF